MATIEELDARLKILEEMILGKSPKIVSKDTGDFEDDQKGKRI